MNTNRKIIAVLVITVVVLSVLICNCSNQTVLVKSQKDSFIFSVMGDVPRSDEEKIILQEQIHKHNQFSSAQFVFHVGDIKSGDSSCDEENYGLVAGYLKKFSVPVFIVPGDNEWNDCGNPTQAWDFWNEHFIAFDQNWKVPFKVLRQQNYPVNTSFVKNNILFIALNLVGGRIHDQTEWDQMQQKAIVWIEQQLEHKGISASVILAQANPDEKHKLFMDQFLPLVENFEKPVLFIHGDGHLWLYDDPWLLPNLVRIQVDKGGIADPLEVTITNDSSVNFKFNRNPFNEKDVLINNR